LLGFRGNILLHLKKKAKRKEKGYEARSRFRKTRRLALSPSGLDPRGRRQLKKRNRKPCRMADTRMDDGERDPSPKKRATGKRSGQGVKKKMARKTSAYPLEMPLQKPSMKQQNGPSPRKKLGHVGAGIGGLLMRSQGEQQRGGGKNLPKPSRGGNAED